MSRIGKQIIAQPSGVDVKVTDGIVNVKGPKGTLTYALPQGVTVKIASGQVEIEVADEVKDKGAIHGLVRSLVNNMVVGVTKGFEERLEMIGVGYRAAVQGQLVDLQIGFSHPTKLEIPAGITVVVEKNTTIIISGSNKQQVGQFAAVIRAVRPPEPYQGKGIRYKGEYVRKKAGKAAASKK